jgi:hypothetical protein
MHDDGSSAGFISTDSVREPAVAAAVLCLALEASHPIVERKSKWKWLHENYVKAILVGAVVAPFGAVAKLLIA